MVEDGVRRGWGLVVWGWILMGWVTDRTVVVERTGADGRAANRKIEDVVKVRMIVLTVCICEEL